MSANNVTREVTAPFAHSVVSPYFQVQATANITTTRQRRIDIGDVIVIDPSQRPESDQMVLVGCSIQPFVGQEHDGVVTGFMSDVI